jgi:hypothetical protein
MAFVPSTITATSRGIAATLAGYIIQNENTNETPVTEQIADQDGAIALEIDYDKRIDLRLTVIDADGNGSIGSIGSGGILSYDGHTWKLDSVEEAGTYNGARRWNITAHRFKKPSSAVKVGFSGGEAATPAAGSNPAA